MFKSKVIHVYEEENDNQNQIDYNRKIAKQNLVHSNEAQAIHDLLGTNEQQFDRNFGYR